MDITNIFTKLNLEILQLLRKEKLHIREIAERLGCSAGKVHHCIQLFKQYHLVQEEDHKNKKVIVLNLNSTLLQNIQHLLETNPDDQSSHPPPSMNVFDMISPLDFRYYGRNQQAFDDLRPYLSEAGFVRYACKTESALTKALAKMGVCSEQISLEIEQASKQVQADEVYREEDRIKHNIRALANCIREKVSEKAKPYVHFTATSHDIICTTDAARYKDCMEKKVIPQLIELEKTLITLALKDKNTIQIGRTHGQHAEPITFGFALAQYVSRLGHSILALGQSSAHLRGKIAGAVGAYNASSLFFSKPEEFERMVLKELKLLPSPISTQVVEAEYMANLVHDCVVALGILANLSDDMRHLQRTEIGEVGEHFEKKQVGSSTMPQKRNPINFENVKSMWKEFMPRMMTMYQDQLSEHQRDLTNSASMRFIPEVITALYVCTQRLKRTMSKLVVDATNMKKNFNLHKEFIAAEPLYILLAAHGHPDAHEYVREKTLQSQRTGKSLRHLVTKDKSIQPYLKKLTKKQHNIINNPEHYTGYAAQKTTQICEFWKKKLR